MSQRQNSITLLAFAAASLLGAQMLLPGCSNGDSSADAAVPSQGAAESSPSGSGDPVAPDFALAGVDGGTIKMADYKGKVVLIDFWATWCGPCRAAIPDLNELYAEHKQSGFEVLGVSVDQDRRGATGAEQVRAFKERIKMSYPLAMANPEVVRAYGGIRSIPTAFLVDRDGRVRQKYVGLRPKSAYEKDIRALLGDGSASAEQEETI